MSQADRAQAAREVCPCLLYADDPLNPMTRARALQSRQSRFISLPFDSTLKRSRRIAGQGISVTRGEEFLQAFEEAHSSLRHLGRAPYARQDVSRIIEPLGSRLETFLRTIVLPMSSRKDTLRDLIAALVPAGLSQHRADALDGLRACYNRSKHAPTQALPLADVIDVVQRAAASISDLVALGLGTVQVPHQPDLNYHLYVGFWDHYTHGETEVARVFAQQSLDARDACRHVQHDHEELGSAEGSTRHSSAVSSRREERPSRGVEDFPE